MDLGLLRVVGRFVFRARQRRHGRKQATRTAGVQRNFRTKLKSMGVEEWLGYYIDAYKK